MAPGRGLHAARGISRPLAPFLVMVRRLLGVVRSRRGASSFTVAFILFIAAVAALLYFRERIQNNASPPVTVPEEASTGRFPSATALVQVQAGFLPMEGEMGDAAADDVLLAAKGALEQGEPRRAITLLRAELESSGDSKRLNAALAASLNAAGLVEFRAGRYERARGLLSEAVGLSGEDAYAKNLAAVRLKLDDAEGAASLLVPFEDDPIVRPVLKDIYIRLGNDAALLGDVVAAARHYGKGAALDPDDAALKEALKKYDKQKSVEAGMGRRDGGHFVVKYEGGENAVAGHLIGMLLEEAYAKVGADFGFYPDDTVTALLYSRERFSDITRSPAWSGGIYDGRIKLPAGGIYDKTDELERVVFHEYTHAVVHRLSKGRAPVWLHEGLAMYEEGQRSGDYAGRLRGLATTGKVALVPLEASFMALDAEGAQVAYLLSLSAAEHMIGEFGIFSAKRVLENLGGGMTLDAAFSGALHLSYAEFERSWIRSIERP